MIFTGIHIPAKEEHMAAIFSSTPRFIIGSGSIKSLGNEVCRLGAGKALIITDRGIAGTGLLDAAAVSLRNAGIKYAVFDGVKPDPQYEIAADAVKLARSEKAGLVVGMGGGSSLDIAKTASVLMTNKGPIEKYFGVDLIPRKGLPAILVPTTAGTGSEATPIAILSDEKEKLKKGIVSPHLFPSAAIIDPELTLSLPPSVTASTGMDALIHAIEAYTSINATSMTDMFCLRALNLIHGNIRKAFSKGKDLNARSAMMEGALFAGIGFANAGVGAVHAFAYPIGAEFHIPHGVANTLMLSYVMRFNAQGCMKKYIDLARLFHIRKAGLQGYEIVDRVISEIERLRIDLGMPQHLSDFGVKKKDVPGLAAGVMKVTRLLANNPRPLTEVDARYIYMKSL